MMHRPSLHKRSESYQSNADSSIASASPSKMSPFKFMTRNVSWDPAITVIVEPKARQTPRHGSSALSKECEPRRPGSALHPLLSPETSAIFDARLAPSAVVATSVAEPATAGGARHLRIISREFPWTLEVSNRNQGIVTCADVFNALYSGLSVALTPSEWSLADDTKKNSMMRANQNRRGGSVRRLRRIDWLGSKVYFRGLTRDDGLGRARLLPEDDLWPDTWVVKFGSH
ncbi:hypothetical protein K439DRAFT_1009252 [Ramaria rubella]|nr:hypothetical protein K439DRAFT_1009252 [Ramaria rubella]